jgi:hypothetical protein
MPNCPRVPSRPSQSLLPLRLGLRSWQGLEKRVAVQPSGFAGMRSHRVKQLPRRVRCTSGLQVGTHYGRMGTGGQGPPRIGAIQFNDPPLVAFRGCVAPRVAPDQADARRDRVHLERVPHVLLFASAAPPRSRKKSSLAALACSLTRSSTKSVLPDSDTVLDEKLELALLRKSMSGSAGPCSLELLSGAHRAVKAGSTSIGVGGRQHAE